MFGLVSKCFGPLKWEPTKANRELSQVQAAKDRDREKKKCELTMYSPRCHACVSFSNPRFVRGKPSSQLVQSVISTAEWIFFYMLSGWKPRRRGGAAGDHEGKNVKQGEKSQEETHPCEP